MIKVCLDFCGRCESSRPAPAPGSVPAAPRRLADPGLGVRRRGLRGGIGRPCARGAGANMPFECPIFSNVREELLATGIVAIFVPELGLLHRGTISQEDIMGLRISIERLIQQPEDRLLILRLLPLLSSEARSLPLAPGD